MTMTEAEKLEKLKILTGEKDVNLLKGYIYIAGEEVLNRAYPFGRPNGARVPEEYEANQINIAVFLLSKNGAEGQTIMNENGIYRMYGGDGHIPNKYFGGIVPMAGVPA